MGAAEDRSGRLSFQVRLSLLPGPPPTSSTAGLCGGGPEMMEAARLLKQLPHTLVLPTPERPETLALSGPRWLKSIHLDFRAAQV